MNIFIVDSKFEYYASELSKALPEATILTAPDAKSAEAMLDEAQATEVLVGLAPYLSDKLIDGLPDLKWIQALTTGVDNLMHLSKLAITNCNGIHGPQMSELALLMMLASSRRFETLLASQRLSKWDRQPQTLLLDKTACLIGVGSIAEHLAGILNALGMKVTGVSSRREAPGFDQLYHRSEMATALGQADFVVVLSPYTPQNHHIIDAEALAAMKPTAHVINLSRGGCVDEAALVDALTTDAIAGAACDVFSTEPLPEDSPFWMMKNMIVTPHIGGFSDVYHEQALPIVRENLIAYALGGASALKGRVDQ